MQRDLLSEPVLQSVLLTWTFKTSHSQLGGGGLLQEEMKKGARLNVALFAEQCRLVGLLVDIKRVLLALRGEPITAGAQERIGMTRA